MILSRTLHLIAMGIALAVASPAYATPDETGESDQPAPTSDELDAAPADSDDAEESADPAMNMAEQHLDDQAARAHFVAGSSLYQAGSFERAAAEFDEAYRLSQRPELLYNIYIAHRDAGDSQRAADALRRYLDEMTEVPDRVNLEARLRALDRQAAEAAEAAAREEAAAAAEPLPPPTGGASPEGADSGPSIVPWVVAGVGGAAILAGAVTGIMALSTTSGIEDECPDDICPASYEEFSDDKDQAETLGTVTDVLLISGGVLATAGVVWALVSGGDTEETDPSTVQAGCDAHGCTARVSGVF